MIILEDFDCDRVIVILNDLSACFSFDWNQKFQTVKSILKKLR